MERQCPPKRSSTEEIEMEEETIDIITDPGERERLLALALMVVLKARSAGVVIGDGENHVMFFTEGDDLRMTSVDRDHPALGLGMFEIERSPHAVSTDDLFDYSTRGIRSMAVSTVFADLERSPAMRQRQWSWVVPTQSLHVLRGYQRAYEDPDPEYGYSG
jgi:hypothetical protein